MDEHIEEFIYTKGKLTQEHYLFMKSNDIII
jgi:hypothetical protein